MAKWVKGQLRGKIIIRLIIGLAIKIVVGVVTRLAAVIREEIIKWDKKALDTLFNKTIKYLVINNYISIINKLYI